jgi:hypothetical protein
LTGKLAVPSSVLDHREYIRLAQDQILLIADGDLGAAVLAVQDLVTGLQVRRDTLPFLAQLARADRDDLALLRLLLGRVRDVETALHLLRLFERLNDHPVRERPDLRGRCRCHGVLLRVDLVGTNGDFLLALNRAEC